MATVPTYQEFMEPTLKVLRGAGLLHKDIITAKVADLVGLTSEQRQVMLPSGRAFTYRSRVWWSLSYLKQAGAVNNPKRGHYSITERGESLLEAPQRPINNKMLKQFPEFQGFLQRASTKTTNDAVANEDVSSELSPDEQLSAAAKTIRAEVKSQLLERLKSVDPTTFEHIVVDVLRAMGYGVDSEDAARVVGGTGDEGIDGVIDEDILGLDSIYIQAKRWTGQVGRPEVQGFVGALQGQNATKGVMISTSSFSNPAQVYADSVSGCRIVLIDGDRLAGLMYDHGIGVSNAVTITTRQLDSDYFPEEIP